MGSPTRKLFTKFHYIFVYCRFTNYNRKNARTIKLPVIPLNNHGMNPCCDIVSHTYIYIYILYTSTQIDTIIHNADIMDKSDNFGSYCHFIERTNT